MGHDGPMKRFIILCLLLAVGVFGSAAFAQNLEPLEVVTSSGSHVLQVEIASDEASRERGLMNRRYMPADRGMLFEFPIEEPVAFWMKDTYIPLDMIFIGHDGAVVGVVENAEPLSETTIPSGAPTSAVLEVNGGVAASLGIRPGDKVKHSFFKP
jgi:uncharacterized membrane protein (UPF0127 family)